MTVGQAEPFTLQEQDVGPARNLDSRGGPPCGGVGDVCWDLLESHCEALGILRDLLGRLGEHPFWVQKGLQERRLTTVRQGHLVLERGLGGLRVSVSSTVSVFGGSHLL